MPELLLITRARLRRHWVGVIVVGLVGALAGAGTLAMLAGARRTDTAYERLRAATRSFDGRATFLGPNRVLADDGVTQLRILPEVASSTIARFRVGRLAYTKDWISTTTIPALDAAASRPQIVRGRSFRIDRPDEAVLSQSTADAMHLDIGDPLAIDFYSDAQLSRVLDNYFVPPEGESVRLKVVGVTRDPDDAGGGRSVLVGPSFLAGSSTTAGFAGVLFRLAPGVTQARAARAIERLDLGPGTQVTWASASAAELDSTRDAIVGGLLIAALVVALAGGIAVQEAAARQVDQSADERDALVAMGLSLRRRIAAATLPGVLAALVTAAGAVGGAIALSALFPTGRIRAFEPHPGTAANLAILGAGAVTLMFLVVGSFAFAGWRAERRADRTVRRLRATRFAPRAERWALGPASFIGTRLAIETGPDRRSVPVRTSLVGIATGVAGVVAAITFASSLQAFVNTPAHYGQAWDLSIETLGARGAPTRLAADPDVEAAALVQSLDASVDDQATAMYSLTKLRGSLVPTVQIGRLPKEPDEIVLGPKLMESVGVDVGDEVDVETAGAIEKMRVVGTALNVDPQDGSFGITAFVTPAAFRVLRAEEALLNEETAVRFRPAADPDAVTRRLRAGIPFGLTDESFPNRPAAVANVAEIGRLPLMIALVLGAVGVVAVAHGVVLAVRRRRHELAVLAALGMTQGQRARIVMAMAGTMIGLGLVVGIPVGVFLGRLVWTLIAQGLRVEWGGTVPPLPILAVTLGAVALAMVVAVLPARSASRVRPGVALRTG